MESNKNCPSVRIPVFRIVGELPFGPEDGPQSELE